MLVDEKTTNTIIVIFVEKRVHKIEKIVGRRGSDVNTIINSVGQPRKRFIRQSTGIDWMDRRVRSKVEAGLLMIAWVEASQVIGITKWKLLCCKLQVKLCVGISNTTTFTVIREHDVRDKIAVRESTGPQKSIVTVTGN